MSKSCKNCRDCVECGVRETLMQAAKHLSMMHDGKNETWRRLYWEELSAVFYAAAASVCALYEEVEN